MSKTIIVGGMIFLADIPLSGQTGVTVESATWYDRHGMPNPDNPAQIVAHREIKERERKAKQEEDFWSEIEKRIKFTTTVEEVKDLPYDPDFNAQCVTNFGDIKIGFKNE